MLDGEQKLVGKAVEGDSSAFGPLYDHYQPMIYRFVFVKVGRREDAEDITHQVFLSAWQNIRNYEHRGHPFSSWLYRIARNLVVDHYRAKRPEASLEKIDPDAFAIPADAPSALAAKMEAEKAMKAVARLKPDYREVIMLRFVEELPLKEVAAALEKTEGAIKLMQHRAIKELQRILAEM